MGSESSKTRRDFIRSGLISVTTAPVLPSLVTASAGAAPVDTPKKKALDKPRNLFNGDTCVYFYNPELWQPEDYALKTVVNPRTGKMGAKPTAVGGPFQAKAIHRYVD